ncbi:MAG: hypothetical protein LUF25_05390 [Phascolarctobacterium sp.]|nr:hypothetical protein [Phascolarctobacterium sp.]
MNAMYIENNHAESSGDTAYGGAIYVDNDGEGSTINVTGNITGNYAVASSGDARGGAIYTSGDVNVTADGTDISISVNYTEGSDGMDDNAIYLNTADGTVTFDISNNGSVTMEDNIRGEDGYSASITGDGTGSSTFYLLNDAYGARLSAGNVTIDTVNNEVHEYALKSFTLTGDVSIAADVDLKNQEMDSFTAESYGSHQGTPDISDVNVISDTAGDTIKIPFAKDGLKDYVTASATENQSAIFKYGVEYGDESDGGYIEVTKTGVNPEVMVASVAKMGACGAASMVYGYAFEHSEYYMNQPYKARFENAGAEDADEGEYRIRKESSLTERGVWVRLFSSFGAIPFSGSFTVKDKYYGMLLGAGSDLKDLGGGWASVLTGYVGYQGVHQEYDGNSIRQDDGIIGVTGSFYKNNFFTAVSVAGSLTTADGRTGYGREKTHLYTYGLAAKAGWNLDYADGKYSIFLSFMASYTNVGADDYTNAVGVRVDPDAIHAIQLNLNIKWIINCRNGLRPYLTVGEVWTVGESMGVSADGYKLDDFSSLKLYIEYGLGV